MGVPFGIGVLAEIGLFAGYSRVLDMRKAARRAPVSLASGQLPRRIEACRAVV